MEKSVFLKKRYKVLIGFLIIIIALITAFKIAVILTPPEIQNTSVTELKRTKVDTDFYTLEDSWLKKNKYGLWELYLSGNDFELGVKNGILAKELIDYQEEAFVEGLKELIPSEFYINFLKYFIAWFNKDMDTYIPLEYQKEIYGISLYASNKYNFIAPNYHRILNYHAAHDIGHALESHNLVACTAFGVKNARSDDSTLLIGRNMDFYLNDKFAENKIIAFYKPENGYNFTFITWGGLMGVLTGMNDQGLTITLNAAKSDIPSSAKTPVTILARKILQYASTIDEAYKIAGEYKTFIAEAFLISSAKENRMVVIEKSPNGLGLYEQNDDEIILTNHFQSETFKNSERTIQNKKESGSVYRWNRTEELLKETEKHNVHTFASILRNQKGIGGKNIGMGNEKAINQLIAHHSVIFKPKQLQIWVSTSPYQLGAYICYDLKTIFSDSLNIHNNIFDSSLTIKPDSFLYSTDYKDFVRFKELTKQLRKKLNKNSNQPIKKALIEEYKNLNPQYYYSNYLIGEYYRHLNNKEKALEYYNIALKKEIPKQANINLILEKIELVKK